MTAESDDRKEEMVLQRDDQLTPGRSSVVRFLRAYAAWMVILVPFAIHVVLAVRNLRLGYHGVVPVFTDLSGADLFVLIRTYGQLFVRPETWLEMARLYALWTVVFMVLSLYRGVRAENNILSGVILFMSHGVASVLILAVILPVLWVLLAGWGPGVVELAPPLVLGFIGVLLTRTARSASRESSTVK